MRALVEVIQSGGCGWDSGTRGDSSARLPHCRLEEHLRLETPACAAGTRPRGLQTH